MNNFKNKIKSLKSLVFVLQNAEAEIKHYYDETDIRPRLRITSFTIQQIPEEELIEILISMFNNVENDFIINKEDFIDYLNYHKKYYIEKFKMDKLTFSQLEREIGYGDDAPKFIIDWIYPAFSLDETIGILDRSEVKKLFINGLFKYNVY